MKTSEFRLLFNSFMLLFVLVSSSFAQDSGRISPPAHASKIENAGTRSGMMTAPLSGQNFTLSLNNKWMVSVRPTFIRKHITPEITALKESKMKQKVWIGESDESGQKNTMAATPQIGASFEANWTLVGTPPDNSMAISNSGMIVTVNNDGIEYYNNSGNFLGINTWQSFFNDPSLTSIIYDPKVIYDAVADRFVMVVLHGSTASTSKVLVCFSKSSNPTSGWWTYTLTGNPLNNNCWFDYPGLGISNNEVYVTGNLFNTGGPFNQAVIYQISKAAGYNGGNINWQYWHNLNATPFLATTLMPASHGHSVSFGPGMYFVSSNAAGENRFRLWDLTDDMTSNPTLNVYTINSTVAYAPSADASQPGTPDLLDNGDCRILNAFYLTGIIHFVLHSDIGSGWNGIHYNRLNVSTLNNQTATYGQPGVADISYPAVASFSNSLSNHDAMIAYLRSSPNTFPEVRVINCDNNMQWSTPTVAKAGEAFVNIINGNERWGDYTGIARRHGSAAPRVWLAGCYGANIPQQSVVNTYKTWIAEVYTSGTGIESIPDLKNISLYPNPVFDLIHILFLAEKNERVTIQLMDVSGKLVRVLYEDVPRQGENKLVFNKGALQAGTYFISIKTNTQILKHEKVVVAD